MAKKIKKRPAGMEYVDPNLEEVDEDRAFEIEYDEELNEIVFVHHYRRKWNDEFDADVEHGLNIDEAKAVVGTMLQLIAVMDERGRMNMEQKSTPEPVEKNPLKDNTM